MYAILCREHEEEEGEKGSTGWERVRGTGGDCEENEVQRKEETGIYSTWKEKRGEGEVARGRSSVKGRERNGFEGETES